MREFFCRFDKIAVAGGPKGVPTPVDIDSEEDLDKAIEMHMEGDVRIGSYTPSPGDSLTTYLAFDLDGAGHDESVRLSDVQATAQKIVRKLVDDGPCYVEVSGSGNGMHVWVLMEPSEAGAVRAYARDILSGIPESDKIEVFPKTHFLPEDGTGNMVWLPRWGGAEGDNCKLLDIETGEYVEGYSTDLKVRPKIERRSAFDRLGIESDDFDRGAGRSDMDEALLQTEVAWAKPPIDELPKMLTSIPNEGSWEKEYDEWFRILAACYHAYGDEAKGPAYEWSTQSSKHEDSKFEKTWRSICGRKSGAGGTVTVGTLLYHARKGGYVQEKPETIQASIRSGSHVEVANYVMEMLGDDDVTFDRGYYWVYDSGCWHRCDKAHIKKQIMDLDGRRFGVGVNDDGTPKVVELNFSASDVRGIEQMLETLCAQPGFFDEAVPGIAFKNGFLSIDGLEDHSRDHRCRLYVREDFNPKAPAPLFRNKMMGRLEKSQQDYLQEKVGACLFGIATDFDIATILLGGGNDGKSQFLDVVSSLFSEDTVTSISPDNWDSEYNRAVLAESRMNLVYEMPSKEVTGSEFVKKIISGERTNARHIREAPFEFHPSAGHIFNTNALPLTSDLTLGFWRRWYIVRFPGPVKIEDRILNFGDKVANKEKVGIYAWAYEGVKRLLKQGAYTVPAGHTGEMERWERRSDTVAAFLYSQASEIDSGGTSLDDLYSQYVMWGTKAGRGRMSLTNFEERLEARLDRRDDGKFKVTLKAI